MTVPQPSENFLDRALHELKSCVTSYFVDYNALGDVYDASEDVLEVWILTGRDQSTVLKTMVDDTFTPSTGIPVNVMLVDPNALLNAVVAGNGPGCRHFNRQLEPRQLRASPRGGGFDAVR